MGLGRCQSELKKWFGDNYFLVNNPQSTPSSLLSLGDQFNPKYAIDNLLRAEIASKSATSLLFSISP